MPAIHLHLDGDHERVGVELGLNRKPVVHTIDNWHLVAMEQGMVSGATSVMLLIPAKVEGIDVVFAAETSLVMWMMAATALASRFEGEVAKPSWASSPDTRALLTPRFVEAIRRAMPSSTDEECAEAVEMILDGFAADGPPIDWS